MKASHCFDGTQTLKFRSFIWSFQLIFHDDKKDFSEYMKKALHATLFKIGKAVNWIEPYIFNLTKKDPNYLLNSWDLLEDIHLTSFGDANEARNAGADLNGIRMKDKVHFSLKTANFRILVSGIGEWVERALINCFRRGLTSRILDQLESHSSYIDSIKDLMNFNLECNTRYHDR
ncbi:hypothetical protein O181_045751 [Austropuccinia psidii MF-1]|uniref:Uncharacterized protein n=1 Tax=Austropuccinia psidii MF-1 TaxID=1389203 RepID=A0A9Q3HI11_9BASI|nr:hypothetical protein [Austropuccinia psidii MF-1]